MQDEISIEELVRTHAPGHVVRASTMRGVGDVIAGSVQVVASDRPGLYWVRWSERGLTSWVKAQPWPAARAAYEQLVRSGAPLVGPDDGAGGHGRYTWGWSDVPGVVFA